MAEVLLFNPYHTSKKEFPTKFLAALPLDLLCIASYLKHRGIDCEICELGIFDIEKTILENNRVRCGISDKEIINLIKDKDPKIIGLGCMYSKRYINVIAIARLIKKVNPSIKVVVGGSHATAFCDVVLKESTIDFVVRGEGEITFYELCNKVLLNKNDFENINGLAYRNGKGEITRTKERELIKNLDDLPMIDYSLVDIKKYAELSYQYLFLMRRPSIGIISSRGCPEKCVYCTVKTVWGRTWRGKSPKRTVDEIELLHKKYGIQEFAFFDDNASLNKKRWNAICDEIINRKLNIRWQVPIGVAHWTLDKPTLKKMKIAGCYCVTFGIESGNVETRKFLGKPYPLSQAKEMIQYANKIGMWTTCMYILGFPYETKQSMDDTVRFAKKSGTDFSIFYLLSPNFASDIYSYFRKEGLLNFDFIFKDNVFDEEKYEEMEKIINDGGASTKYFTSEELKGIIRKAYRSFIIYRAITYLNLLVLLRKIQSIEDLKHTGRVILTGSQILMKSKKTREKIFSYEIDATPKTVLMRGW